MTGYRKPRVTWHTPETAPKQRMYEGKYNFVDYEAKLAAEKAAAQPALDEAALMDYYIRAEDQRRAQTKANELAAEQRGIERDRLREEHNAAVLAEVRQAKAQKQAEKVKAEREAELNRKLAEVETGLQGYEATDEEIQIVRNRLSKQQRTEMVAWVLALTELRMERAEL